MITLFRTMAVAAFVLVSFPALSMAAECVLPDAPALPDGSKASKEDMLETSRAVKKYQTELTEFRGCLEVEGAAIEGSDKEAKAARKVLNDRYNGSVDTEEAVAIAFNAQIRSFNAAKIKE